MTPKKRKKNKPAKPKKTLRRTLMLKKKAHPKKAAAKKKTAREKRKVRGKSQSVATIAFEREAKRARSGGQSGDLQGLSDIAGADSERVDELIEEGNAFEASAVKGVQDAPDADQGEIKTHEVPEDDVPEEYSDKDE